MLASQRILLAVALLKSFVGLGGFLFVWAAGSSVDFSSGLFVNAASTFLYLGVALALLGLARGDHRALLLSTVCALIASASGPLHDFAAEGLGEPLRPLLAITRSIYLEPLLGFASLAFALQFPHARLAEAGERIGRRLLFVSGALGLLLSVAGVLSSLGSFAFGLISFAAWWFNAVWGLAAAVLMIRRARVADLEERRRVAILLGGVFVGNLILMLALIAQSFFPVLRDRDVEGLALGFRWFTWFSWILPALTIPYALLVDQVFDLRFALRQALRYSLARSGLTFLIALPFVGLGAVLFAERHRSLAEIVTAGPVLVLALLTVLAVAVAALRKPLFRSIDRQFFREEYDARQILATLMERSREVSSIRDLLALLMREIDRALHPDTVAALALDPRKHLFRSPKGEVRPLREESLLAEMLTNGGKAVPIDLGRPDSPLNSLPHQEQQWLTEGAYHLLVPMVASDDSLIGLLCLGEKRSELPYSVEDRELLEAVAASASLSLENRWMASSQSETSSFRPISGPVTISPREEGGLECPKCGKVFELGGASRCEPCDRYLEPAILPPSLLEKYQVQRRLGAGGMGVVYEAVDDSLGRRVAIKTLPKVAPEKALRLRREARVMATITHPNLALILAAEAFQGRPLLVFEFLDGGTLAERLEAVPLSESQALELGITLAGVLESAHAKGILHRDVKPGNVGYTAAGTPKLLDFGLAKLIDGPEVVAEPARLALGRALPDDVTEASITRTQQVVGTPAYLSPEAVAGRKAEPSFDLWSLALTLYECLSGENPMRTGSLGRTLDRISACEVPDVRTFRPDCSAEFARFLSCALGADLAERPQSAADFRSQLLELRRRAA
ncbi:MAG: protein kinase [Acidobacteriota bacterium]